MKTPESILRNETPTDGIETAAADFRFAPPVSGGAKTRRWPAAAGLATALAVGAGALWLSAPAAEASPLARIVQAERDAPRCASVFYRGDGTPWGRGWQEGRKARFDLSPNAAYASSQGTDGRRIWFVRRDSRTAIVKAGDVRVVPPLDQKIADYRGKVVRSSESADGTKILVIERPASATSYLQRDTIVADEKDRPVSVLHEHFKKGRWIVGSRERRDYDTPIPPETFTFRPPKGYEVYDIDANRTRLLDGLRHGPTRKVGGVVVRLAGVLQDRHGTVTVVYSGGATPLPDARAEADRAGAAYPGWAVVGTAPDPRAGKPHGRGVLGWPTHIVRASRGERVEATPEPFLRLDGVGVRLVRFHLPKLPGNPPQRLRLTLPVVVVGKARTVGAVVGRGAPKGTVTFVATTIPSNDGEEIGRMPNAKPAAYEIPLAQPKRSPR